MQRMLRTPGRLQWRLTLSYTFITLVTVLLVELLTILVVLGYFLFNQATVQSASFRALSNQAVPYFAHGQPDPVELQAWLDISSKSLTFSGSTQSGFVCVIDGQRTVRACTGHSAPPVQSALNTSGYGVAQAQLQGLLLGQRSAIVSNRPDNLLLVIVPIQRDGEQPSGALVALVPALTLANTVSSYGRLAGIFGVNVLLLTLLVGLVGTIFGFWTARGFTRRFTRLAQATDEWSRGDFSTLIKDPVADEIGQLANRMDRMAEQLQQLLRTRQQLAAVEERNRLARDLHDSVKQQIFSVAMQLGTLRILLTRDTDKAQQRLLEIEQTVKLAQQELTALIRELRPIALEDNTLEQALQDLAAQWMQQTWIAATVDVKHEDEGSASGQSATASKLPAAVEDALFRIAQEALSNVARHSNATQVVLRLLVSASQVILLIKDNGRGFAATRKDLALYTGVGLRSMQERVQPLHGSVDLQSSKESGTTVTVTCPLAQPIDAEAKAGDTETQAGDVERKEESKKVL